MFQNSASPSQTITDAWLEQLSAASAKALEALAGGDYTGAERCAKAISAMARAARDIAELEFRARPFGAQENAHDIRAELERRLVRYVEADRATDLLGLAERGGGEVPP